MKVANKIKIRLKIDLVRCAEKALKLALKNLLCLSNEGASLEGFIQRTPIFRAKRTQS